MNKIKKKMYVSKFDRIFSLNQPLTVYLNIFLITDQILYMGIIGVHVPEIVFLGQLLKRDIKTLGFCNFLSKMAQKEGDCYAFFYQNPTISKMGIT